MRVCCRFSIVLICKRLCTEAFGIRSENAGTRTLSSKWKQQLKVPSSKYFPARTIHFKYEFTLWLIWILRLKSVSLLSDVETFLFYNLKRILKRKEKLQIRFLEYLPKIKINLSISPHHLHLLTNMCNYVPTNFLQISQFFLNSWKYKKKLFLIDVRTKLWTEIIDTVVIRKKLLQGDVERLRLRMSHGLQNRLLGNLTLSE